MKTPLQPADGDHYQRPNQIWVCGLAEEGVACPHGPDARGRCPGTAQCHPVRDGDRWMCNRSALRGGPCSQGPDPDGRCPCVSQCRPARSLRHKRGRMAASLAAAACGALLMTLSANWRNEALAPGPLSVHHAQLLHPSRQTERCAACHEAGGKSAQAWLIGDDSPATPQHALCLKCHDQVIEPELALAAHTSRFWEKEATDSSAGRPRRDPRAPIACASCHREHQGSDHSLVAIDDDACQACHQTQFTNFALDHPAFDDWPYRRRTPIRFDHASHEGKHYVEAKRDFHCAECHAADESGARQTTLNFETSCAGCHDEKMQLSWAEGVELLALPELDVELLQESSPFGGPWPEAATGDFDG
ncbi:MAG: hypothetical protein KDA61_07825, partial [Planctomycetales bacterium]|nr:hypothetical protein [Planctomycetales bacterium]